jgi:uncharacterized repeat protein (TIGR01451 family)
MQKPLLLLLFLFSTSVCLYGQVSGFKLNRAFGAPVTNPGDMALDQDNYLYLLESRVINKIDPAGQVVESFPIAGPYDYPQDLAVDQQGNMYVTSIHAYIQKFSPTGKLLMRFGSTGTGPGEFEMADVLAVDAAGNMVVADSKNNRVQLFNAQGEFMSQFFPAVTDRIVDLKIGKSGNFYLLTKDFTILKTGPDGQPLASFKVTGSGFTVDGFNALALDAAENIFVTEEKARAVYKLTGSGQLRQILIPPAPANGNSPFGTMAVAVSAAGDTYISNSGTIQVFAPEGIIKKSLGEKEDYRGIAQDNLGNYFLLNVNRSTNTFSIVKYNAYGILLTEFGNTGPEAERLRFGIALVTDELGNIYCLDVYQGKWEIKKFSNEGKYLTRMEDFGSDLGQNPFQQKQLSDLAIDHQGNLYVTDYYGDCIRKMSPAGKFLTRFGTSAPGPQQIYHPVALAIDRKGNFYVGDNMGFRIRKLNAAGQALPEFTPVTLVGTSGLSSSGSLAVDNRGLVYAYTNENDMDGKPILIQVYSAAGKKVEAWPANFQSEVSINRTSERLLVAGGEVVQEYWNGNAPRANQISGLLYQDANANCQPDAADPPLAGVLVKAEPGPYYGVSDALGRYTIPVDTGRYTVQPILPQDPGRTITPTCMAPIGQPVVFPGYGQAVKGPDFGNQVSTAPVLRVEVASDRRRRCFRNTTTLSYSNIGFSTARGAKVTVQLPEFVSFVSADMPHSQDSKGNYVFAVGDLQPNQRGTITLLDSVSCADPSIRNLTVCTKAWITPVNTYPTPANWNRADISVTGKTLADGEARFVIRNQGLGDMTDSLFFRIYQDANLVLNSKYKLAAQDSLVLRFAPTGRALRLEADQPEGHPLKATAGVNVEVRQKIAFGLPAIPMMAFPPDDPEPEIAQDCQPIIDSFDPNDKQVLPLGFTADRYTPTNTPLRYTIRFQNTGTDYAYRVVVVDTLSTDLDLATLQVGAVSHGYRLAVTGKAKPVLTFTFDNIMLPDSARDLAGSNGFIQFSIKPKGSLPGKTKIENYADIFFDYNEPVRTNTTVNRIYDMPQVVQADMQLSSRAIITTPEVTGFFPLQSRPGTEVTIRGRNFASTAAGNQVTFNGEAATVLSAADSVLTVLVPANAFSGKIKVTTADGAAKSSSDYVIYQPPTITALSATEGVPGAVITITGTHFSPVLNQDTVSFDSVAAKVLEATETTLKTEVPAGATLGKIQLKTLGGQAQSTLSFRVWYPPVISTFSPAKGKAGTPITITGSNFAEAAARNGLQFDDKTAEVLEATGIRLVVKVPAAAPSGKLRLQTPGGHASSASGFTFIPAPVITAFTPPRAHAGVTITITGENFQADNQADTVYFNGKLAKVLQLTPTGLQVQAPKGVTSGTIVVAGAGGRAEAGGFEVPELAPVEAIFIYPNPTKGGITVNWFKADFTVEQMQVYNAIGKLVVEQGLTGAANDEQQLLLSQFGSGVYIFRFRTSAGTIVKRVVAL